MRDERRYPTTRLQGDGGSIVVESAMILPFVVMCLSGIVDFGVGFRDRLTIQGALRTSIRQVAFLANGKDADKATISSLNAGLGNLKNVAIQRAVIYKIDTTANPDGNVPAACTINVLNNSGSGVPGVCNTYNANQLTNAETSFVMSGSNTAGGACTTGWDQYFCPTTRKRAIVDPPDWVGLWITVTYTPFTRMFRTSITMEDEAIIRLEPAPG